MTPVIRELVHPLQPTVVVPLVLRFWRFPFASDADAEIGDG